MMAGTLKRGPNENGLLVAVFAVYVCFCLLSTVGAASAHIPKKREIASTGVICNQNTACGWAIYIPFTRQIDYFMRNTCDCDPAMICAKHEDDLAINAYVYRCKAGSTTNDLF